jgi:hypothetical protein
VGLQEELAVATINEDSLPGTYAPPESTLQITQLVGVLQDGLHGTKLKGPLENERSKCLGQGRCHGQAEALDNVDAWTS